MLYRIPRRPGRFVLKFRIIAPRNQLNCYPSAPPRSRIIPADGPALLVHARVVDALACANRPTARIARDSVRRRGAQRASPPDILSPTKPAPDSLCVPYVPLHAPGRPTPSGCGSAGPSDFRQLKRSDYPRGLNNAVFSIALKVHALCYSLSVFLRAVPEFFSGGFREAYSICRSCSSSAPSGNGQPSPACSAQRKKLPTATWLRRKPAPICRLDKPASCFSRSISRALRMDTGLLPILASFPCGKKAVCFPYPTSLQGFSAQSYHPFRFSAKKW